MSNARNHHYVPQCYLKGFAKLRSKSSKLKAYDIRRGKVFAPTPRNIGSKRDYNRIDIVGVDPNFIESEWSKIESQFDQALGRVISAHSIDDETDLHWILALLSRIIVSNPDYREVRSRFIEDVSEGLLRSALSNEKTWNQLIQGAGIDASVPYKQMKLAVSERRIIPKTAKEKLVQDETELWPKILDSLVQRNWTLIVAAQSEGCFATSDRPFSLRFDEARMGKALHRPGLALKGTTLLFPISRSLVIAGCFEEVVQKVTATRDQIALINNEILMAAGEQLYCSSDFPIVDFGGNICNFESSQIWARMCEEKIT